MNGKSNKTFYIRTIIILSPFSLGMELFLANNLLAVFWSLALSQPLVLKFRSLMLPDCEYFDDT